MFLTTGELRRRRVHERCDWKCWYCGKDFSAFKTRDERNMLNINEFPTVEHQIPQSRGGHEGADNVVTACKRCNSEKGTKTLEEYRRYRRLLHPAGQAHAALSAILGRIREDIPPHVHDTLAWIETYCPDILFFGERSD
jgi:5-methylcytosine-specific restriction endonuclease McrA